MAFFSVRIEEARVYTRVVEADTAADAATQVGDLVRADDIEPESRSIHQADARRMKVQTQAEVLASQPPGPLPREHRAPPPGPTRSP